MNNLLLLSWHFRTELGLDLDQLTETQVHSNELTPPASKRCMAVLSTSETVSCIALAASQTSAISWMRTSRSNNTSWRRVAVSFSSFFCNVPSWQWRDANPGRTSYPLRRLSARPPPGPFQVRPGLPLSVRAACARYRRPPGQLRRGATRSAQRCSTARRCESPVASRCVLLRTLRPCR